MRSWVLCMGGLVFVTCAVLLVLVLVSMSGSSTGSSASSLSLTPSELRDAAAVAPAALNESISAEGHRRLKSGLAVWGHAAKPGFDPAELLNVDAETRAGILEKRRFTDNMNEVVYQFHEGEKPEFLRREADSMRANSLELIKLGSIPIERTLFSVDVCNRTDKCRAVNPCAVRWEDWGFTYNPTVKESIVANSMMRHPRCVTTT